MDRIELVTNISTNRGAGSRGWVNQLAGWGDAPLRLCWRALTILLLATLGGVLTMPPSTAHAAATLRSVVNVETAIVKLGDLFENAGIFSEVAVFRSPDPGREGTVQVRRIARAAARHGMQWKPDGSVAEVRVIRASSQVDTDYLRQEIVRAVRDRIGVNNNNKLRVSFYGNPAPIYLDASASGQVELVRFDYRRRSGNFRVDFRALDGPDRHTKYSLRGRVSELVDVPVAARPLARGSLINESDITIQAVERNMLVDRVVVNLDELIGMSLRRSVRAGDMVRRDNLTVPKMVERNRPVTIIYKSRGLMLSVQGQALEDAAMGELISVRNPRSNRVVHALVSGPGEVTVSPFRSYNMRTANGN